MMDTSKVIAPLGGTILVVVLDEVLAGSMPHPKVFIGFGFIVVTLGMLADGAPQVAVPLAWLVFVAILLMRGPDLLAHFSIGSASPKNIRGIVGKATPSGSAIAGKPTGNPDAPFSYVMPQR